MSTNLLVALAILTHVEKVLDMVDRLRSGNPTTGPRGQRGGNGPSQKRDWEQVSHTLGMVLVERLICVVDQPCILCEETLEVWHVFKDEEQKGKERIERRAVAHQCRFLDELRESRRSDRREPEL